MNLSTTIGGIPFTSCLMNDSGCWCTTEQELDNLKDSLSGAIVSKSSTIQHRKGNPEPRLYLDQYGSLNSMGIPNLGYQFYMNYGNQVTNKPFIQSIYPFNVTELETMLFDINKIVNIKRLIEINFSCPNITSQTETYNFKIFNEYLDRINQMQLDNLVLGLKLPPFYELYHFDQMANLLLRFQDKIKFITCINSIVNGLIIDHEAESTRIQPKNGLGGIGGIYCKPTALSNVYNFHRLLGDKIDIIGCGGCSSGIDVFEHLLCGAKAVQIGTHLMRNGPYCFEPITNELIDIMESKKYQQISDYRGKVHVTTKST